MKILYSKTLDGICIRRCFGLDGTVQIPDSLAGGPVTRLAAYLFSGSMARALRDLRVLRLRGPKKAGMRFRHNGLGRGCVHGLHRAQAAERASPSGAQILP